LHIGTLKDKPSTGDRASQKSLFMMTYPGEAGEGATDKSPEASAPLERMTPDQLRAELNTLRERERQIVELLNAKSSDRILHDLRNLLNEVQLLRILAEQSNA
jgi:hypothetical protein